MARSTHTPVDRALLARIADELGAASAELESAIQDLWSGYGQVCRVRLVGGPAETVVAKVVAAPGAGGRHPRGWNSDRSNARKLRSYGIERVFYERYAGELGAACRVARWFGGFETPTGFCFLLEDLDAAGFAERRRRVGHGELLACIGWLARFHARTLCMAPDGLWPQGTYWHLQTRPDELAAMRNRRLQAAAPALDRCLRDARWRCLVHGDAKLANFCFSGGAGGVAAVDFQYVGGGVGVQDVAYLLSSALSEGECQRRAAGYVDAYFEALAVPLAESLQFAVLDEVEAEWRALYPVAWADFVRFLDGWAPGHQKLHGYSLAQTEAALAHAAVAQSMRGG